MNRALLLQIKSKVKQIDDGTSISLGQRPPPPPPLGDNDRLSLESLCLSQVVTQILQKVDEKNFEKVNAQFAYVPTDVKLKILQYMILRRELGVLSSLATLSNLHFTVFVAPRNYKLTDEWAYQFAPMCVNLEVLDVRGCSALTLFGVLDIVRVCGPKLVHLDVSGRKKCSDIKKVLQLTPNLKFLGARDTGEDFSILTDLPQLCPQIQQLELSYSRGFSAELISIFVKGLKDLIWLDFSWCSGVYDDSVIIIAQTLKERLAALNLEMCCRDGSHVTEKSIIELAKNCPNLQQLSVTALRFVTDAAVVAVVQSCPNLKSLHISGCEISDAGIRAIAAHCQNLEYLSMSGLSEVTDACVLQILEKCEKLQLIDLSNCPRITNETKQKFGKKFFVLHSETNANCILFIPFLPTEYSFIIPISSF